MRLGVLLGLIDGADSKAITNFAVAAESAGYASIWSSQAMGRGFMLSDPFIALSAIASVTESVEVGTAILQLPLYNPTDIALKSFSLAQLSSGRFILGVGAGSTGSDYELHRADFSRRFARFEEKLAQLRTIFSTGQVDGIKTSAWDSVSHGVPLFFGTWGHQVRRAATEFDGWIASGMNRSVAEVTEAIVKYRKADGGRAIVSTIQIAAGQDLGELKDRLNHYDEAGFDDAVVIFSPGGPSLDQVRKLLD